MKQSDGWKEAVRPGRYVELKRDVNCIPAGVYYLADKEQGNFVFTLGKRVLFGLSDDCEEFLRELPSSRGFIKRTSLKNFLDAYYERYYVMRDRKQLTFGGPKSFCCIDPAVAYEVN